MNKTMNRRSALRTMLYIAGGTLILPACMRESGRASIEMTNLSITEADEILLENIVEALIPSTETPGGKELLLHLFVLKMVDDCHSPEDHTKFSEGIKKFALWSHEELSIPFTDAPHQQQTDLLARIESAKDDLVKDFFKITKRRTIQGYMNSRYVMNNLVKYEIAPGRYDGYFPMEREQR